MPDVTHNGRTLDFTGENVKVKYRDAQGKVVVADKATIIAQEATILTITGLGAATEEAIKTGYKNGINDPHDEDNNSYKTTWITGKALAYDTADYNTNFLLDVTV